MHSYCFTYLISSHPNIVDSGTTIKDIKEILYKLTEIEPSNQIIEITNGFDNFRNNRNNNDYFWNNLAIHVYDISKFPLKISHNFYQKEIILDTNNSIEQLKKYISEKIGIPKERQLFYSKNKLLCNEIILKNEKLHKINFKIFTSTFLYNNSSLKIKYPDSKIKEIKTDFAKTGIELIEEIENKKFKHESEIPYNIKNKNKVLPLDDLLLHCGIKEGDLLELEKRNTFKILIKSLAGKTIKINVSSKDTIYMVKYYIYLNEGIPTDQIRLIFKGIQLIDDKIVKEYKLEKDSVLHMVLKLRG